MLMERARERGLPACLFIDTVERKGKERDIVVCPEISTFGAFSDAARSPSFSNGA